MNSLVLFDMGLKGLDKGGREDVQILRIANVYLCKEITKSPKWPMQLPVDGVSQKAREALLEEVKVKPADLGKVLEEQSLGKVLEEQSKPAAGSRSSNRSSTCAP